jgi:leucyl-tRNA synthetase
LEGIEKLNMKNLYITTMFPYPSSSGLHCGHWYNYAIVDSFCKIEKYKGNEVFQPFGYDSFGLPAENYARKMGRDPKEITEESIQFFNSEMNRMGTGFEYKFSTHSEDYQKRSQWLFNKLLEHDLAYKAFREQDYCPSCETVLAREQVKYGYCERCKTAVEKKELEQWFFRITKYKQRLIDDLDKVDYPEKTKKQQIHWLGDKFTDWCVSRQRKWGCPIPVDGETDTMDTFVDSSFYTIEYDRTRPVDIYVGGNEHACMHLIYARFITKFLYDIGYIDFDEPFKQVIHQGMILGEDGNKMSKSVGNVINPDKYEPQLLKMYLMFINHYFEGGKWQDSGYIGCEKFRRRLFVWLDNHGEEMDNFDQKFDIFKDKIFDNFSKWKTNKVVSDWMIFFNNNKKFSLSKEQSKKIVEFFNTCF